MKVEMLGVTLGEDEEAPRPPFPVPAGDVVTLKPEETGDTEMEFEMVELADPVDRDPVDRDPVDRGDTRTEPEPGLELELKLRAVGRPEDPVERAEDPEGRIEDPGGRTRLLELVLATEAEDGLTLFGTEEDASEAPVEEEPPEDAGVGRPAPPGVEVVEPAFCLKISPLARQLAAWQSCPNPIPYLSNPLSHHVSLSPRCHLPPRPGATVVVVK